MDRKGMILKAAETLMDEGFSFSELLLGNAIAAAFIKEMQAKKVPVDVSRSAIRQLSLLINALETTPEGKAAMEADRKKEASGRKVTDIDPGFPDGHVI